MSVLELCKDNLENWKLMQNEYRDQLTTRKNRLRKSDGGREEGASSTSNISNARSPQNSTDLAGRSSIVADGDNVAQRPIVLLNQIIEDVNKTVGGTAT